MRERLDRRRRGDGQLERGFDPRLIGYVRYNAKSNRAGTEVGAAYGGREVIAIARRNLVRIVEHPNPFCVFGLGADGEGGVPLEHGMIEGGGDFVTGVIDDHGDRDTAAGGDAIVAHCNDSDRMCSIAESVGIEGGGLVGIRVGDTKTIDVNLIGCRLKVVAGFGGKGEVDDA